MIPAPPVTLPVVIVPLPLCKVVEVVSTELPRFIVLLVVAMVPARFKSEAVVAVNPPAKVRESVIWSPRVVVPVLFRVVVVAPVIFPPERILRLNAPLDVLRLVAFNVPLNETSLLLVVASMLRAPVETGLVKLAPPLLVMVIPPVIEMPVVA